MKLRNKKTGEIIDIYKGEIIIHCNQGRETIHFKRLEDLEEWEDYEESKTEFYITSWGDIREYTTVEERFAFKQKLAIGNYFKTREEAEKAVEKLKAWKRLKDKGFRFVGWQDSVSDNNPDMILFKLDMDAWETAVCDDLDQLFGGEE